MRPTTLVRALLGALLAALSVGCETRSPASTPGDAGAPSDAPSDAPVVDGGDPGAASRDLYRFLLGRFDSRSQSRRSPAYFNITLVTCRVSLPELGEQVMYVEQAVAGMRPYRQRLYVVEALGDTGERAVSRVFELGDPARAVGYCDDPARAALAADDAVERQGCPVFVTRRGDRFEGGTVGPDCASTMSGAAYATSDVVVRADGFTSWDRGYNRAAMQVWGAVAGPYEFERRSPIEP